VLAPRFVAKSETAWNTNASPKTASVTVSPGDGLVVIGVTEDSSTTLGTPTGGGLTYANPQSINISNNCSVYAWTATSATAQTFSVSVSAAGNASNHWGMNVLQFSATAGFGASNKANSTGAPSLALTTQRDNSAIVVVSGDWVVVDGSARTWDTSAAAFSEQTYNLDSSHYTVYGGFYPSVGALGSKTVGLTAPTGQTFAIIAVEVFGSAGPPLLVTQAAIQRAANW
jgi:hypothetical protein